MQQTIFRLTERFRGADDAARQRALREQLDAYLAQCGQGGCAPCAVPSIAD